MIIIEKEKFAFDLLNGTTKQWPSMIRLDYLGDRDEYYFVGTGAYPYECNMKNSYPNSGIYYKKDSIGWVASHQLVETSEDHYKFIE